VRSSDANTGDTLAGDMSDGYGVAAPGEVGNQGRQRSPQEVRQRMYLQLTEQISRRSTSAAGRHDADDYVDK